MNQNKTQKNEGVFQVAVGVVIEHLPSGEILLLQRHAENSINAGEFEPVYGRLDQYESLEDGLKREVSEETGLKDIKIIEQLSYWHIFRGEKCAKNEVIGLTFWCQTNQREIVLSAEHQKFLWVTKEKIGDYIKKPDIRKDVESVIYKRARQIELIQSGERAKKSLADYQNLLNRVDKVRQEITSQAGVEIVEQLLSPIEHLGLAAREIANQGLDMVIKEFGQVLTKIGLTEVATVGMKFDPSTMEAVGKQGKGESVKQVVKQGYSYNGRIIQHAKVLVG